jgi:hypothetical protein
MDLYEISRSVVTALPTTAELRIRQRAEAQAEAAEERKKFLRGREREADATRARLHEVLTEIQNETGLREQVAQLAGRFAGNASEVARLELGIKVDGLLGVKDVTTEKNRRTRIATLAKENQEIEENGIPKRIKAMHALQKRIPALLEEKQKLLARLYEARPA